MPATKNKWLIAKVNVTWMTWPRCIPFLFQKKKKNNKKCNNPYNEKLGQDRTFDPIHSAFYMARHFSTFDHFSIENFI